MTIYRPSQNGNALLLPRVIRLLTVCLLLWPELNVPILPQTASLNELTLFPHQVLHCDLPIAENIQMVANDMSIPAAGTGNQRRAPMVALLRDIVMRSVPARHTRKRDLVAFWLDGRSLPLANGFSVRGVLRAGFCVGC